mgnify:CR=1 FL=1
MEPKETDIQFAICEYLFVKKHFFWRSNTIPVFDTKANRYRPMPKYSMTGIPDIIVIRDGIFVGIEVKRPGGKLSDSQKVFKEKCLESGAEYYIVSSIDDVEKIGL